MLLNDPADAHFEVDPARLDLAREFRAAPRGPHSPDLQRVLHRMRWSAPGGRFVLVALDPGRRWMLAEVPLDRDLPMRTFPDRVFTSLAEAEWHVFRVRWEALTGAALSEDLA
jgi:hypothetical protein